MDQDYGTPFPPLEEQAPKKSNTPLIIIIVVLVLLCCCCVVLAAMVAGLWNYGDEILGITWLPQLASTL